MLSSARKGENAARPVGGLERCCRDGAGVEREEMLCRE